MVKLDECIKIGDKYYLKEDVYKIFDDRMQSVVPEDA